MKIFLGVHPLSALFTTSKTFEPPYAHRLADRELVEQAATPRLRGTSRESSSSLGMLGGTKRQRHKHDENEFRGVMSEVTQIEIESPGDCNTYCA